MGAWRHPFESTPYAAVAYPAPRRAQLGLDARDHALIRGLRPETAAMWAVTGGSALLSTAVYWGIWGAPIACGLVLGMWIHELGHLVVLRRLGLDSAPIVFVPFIGATQRLRARPARASDGALLALAGPVCGLLFACACKLGYAASGDSVLRFLGAAHTVLAVVDLLPFGALDGARVVAALTQRERMAYAAATAALAIFCESLLLVPLCAALAWSARPRRSSDRQTS